MENKVDMSLDDIIKMEKKQKFKKTKKVVSTARGIRGRGGKGKGVSPMNRQQTGRRAGGAAQAFLARRKNYTQVAPRGWVNKQAYVQQRQNYMQQRGANQRLTQQLAAQKVRDAAAQLTKAKRDLNRIQLQKQQKLQRQNKFNQARVKLQRQQQPTQQTGRMRSDFIKQKKRGWGNTGALSISFRNQQQANTDVWMALPKGGTGAQNFKQNFKQNFTQKSRRGQQGGQRGQWVQRGGQKGQRGQGRRLNRQYIPAQQQIRNMNTGFNKNRKFNKTSQSLNERFAGVQQTQGGRRGGSRGRGGRGQGRRGGQRQGGGGRQVFF